MPENALTFHLALCPAGITRMWDLNRIKSINWNLIKSNEWLTNIRKEESTFLKDWHLPRWSHTSYIPHSNAEGGCQWQERMRLLPLASQQQSAWHSVMDAGRGHESPSSEMKGFLAPWQQAAVSHDPVPLATLLSHGGDRMSQGILYVWWACVTADQLKA